MTKSDYTKFQDNELKPMIKQLVDRLYSYYKENTDKQEIEDHRLNQLKTRLDKLNENNKTDSSEVIGKLTEILLEFLDNDVIYRGLFFYWLQMIEKLQLTYEYNEYRMLKSKEMI